jgi:DNA-binding NarL/FixJ family response regulator
MQGMKRMDKLDHKMYWSGALWGKRERHAEGRMKIMIADSQTRVRHGLRILLEQQPGWNVEGEAANANELIEQIHSDCPDLVLLDGELPGMPLERLMVSLREDCPDVLIVSLSGRYEQRQTALEAGADAFASKAEPPEKLIRQVRNLIKSEIEVYYDQN